MEADQPASSDKRTLTVALVLGVLGLIGVAIIVVCVWRMKLPDQRQQQQRQEEEQRSEAGTRNSRYAFVGFGNTRSPKSQGVQIDSNGHPAARITPFAFGKDGDGPVYGHEPGDNMRIASRQANGIWTFHDVDPHTGSPLGTQDPSPSPSSANTAYSTSPYGQGVPFTWEPRGYSSLRSGEKTRKRSVGNALEWVDAPPAVYGVTTTL